MGAAGGGVGGHASRVCLSSDRQQGSLWGEHGAAHGEELSSRGLRHQMVRSLGSLPATAFLCLPSFIYSCVLIGFLQILIYVSGADVILTLYKPPASELHLFSPTYQK